MNDDNNTNQEGLSERQGGPVEELAAAAATPRIWKFRPVEIVGLVALMVYSNTLGNQFVFDSIQWVQNNPSVRSLWPIWDVLTMRPMSRPLVNLSLAINYAISGQNPWSYSIFNMLVHAAAAVTLLALVHQGLRSRRLRERFAEPTATYLATAAAMIWAVHPLTTQAVAYMIQRAESMTGLFYLLTLWAAGRVMAGGSWRWVLAAVAASAAGMACKQVMVTAPILVLLYDRIFWAQSWREVFKRRWWLYVGLVATWGLLLTSAGTLFGGATAGFGLKRFTPWEYLATQPGVILHYLHLTFWPDVLVLDYAWPIAHGAEILLPAVIVGLLIVASVFALWRWPAAGFLAVAFLIILAPSSSILPIEDIAEEHRMYLPLSALVVLVVVLGWSLGRRAIASLAPDPASRGKTASAVALLATALLVVALGLRTYTRNKDYQNEGTIWAVTLQARPDNPRAHLNYAVAGLQPAMVMSGRLASQGDSRNAYAVAMKAMSEAEPHLRQALQLDPGYSAAMLQLGQLYATSGSVESRMIAADEQAGKTVPLERKKLAGAMLLTSLAMFDEAAKLAEQRQQYALQMQADRAAAQLDAQVGNTVAAAAKYVACAEVLMDRLGDQPYASEAARAQLNEALKLDPTNARAAELLRKLPASMPAG